MDKSAIYGVLVLVVFVSAVLSKSLDSSNAFKDIYDQPYSCKCKASIDNSTAKQTSLGTVKVITLHEDTDASMHDVTKGETSPCHALRHRCHKACVAAAGDLKRHVGGEADPKVTLGYQLCMGTEQNTPSGGVKIYAHPSLHAPQCQYHHDELKVAVAPAKLCCGHTYITPEQNAPPVKAYGWNPDCHASQFILGY